MSTLRHGLQHTQQMLPPADIAKGSNYEPPSVFSLFVQMMLSAWYIMLQELQ